MSKTAKGPLPGIMAQAREDRGWEGWWLELGVPTSAALAVAGCFALAMWLVS